MKVAIVNSYFPPWRGGAETYAYNLSKALVARGHDVTVVCGSDPLPPGISEAECFLVKRLRILRRIYGTPILLGLYRTLCQADVDIFHANFPSPYIAFTVAAVSLRKRIPAVLTWHNDLPPVTSGARFLIEAHDRLVLPSYIRSYRKIIATSTSYMKRSRLLKRYRNMVSVVPNGIDTARFHPRTDGTQIRNRLGLGGRFTVLFVGALTKWHRYKGLEALFEAFGIALRRNENMELVVVGDGELREFYRSLAQRLKLERHVIFAGDVPDALLPQYYAASDVLALPSKDMSEGFGLTLLEANATGKPVIASDVGGVSSVVRNGYNGILVRPHDTMALAQGMEALREDMARTHQMGRNGRKWAKRHDWSHVAMETDRIYSEVS